MEPSDERRPCPTESELRLFAAGDLPASRFDLVALHVEGCSACDARLESLDVPADPIVAGIRGPSPNGAEGSTLVPEALLGRARALAGGTVAAPPPAAAGRSLGKFELLEELGRGSFGCVYRARDTELDRTVAIKVLHAGSLPGPVEVERFLREARSTAQLKHPGIVLLYGAGRTETGVCYLVHELVQGGTLAVRLKSGRLDFRRAAELTEAIAEALDYAHRQGVIHRDLKPSNIVLDPDGRPHLMDFGLAKRDADDPPATPCGLVLGTPAYMSPEQAGGDSRLVDARSDIYSLGVVLYELLTGRRPFEGSEDQQIIQVLQDFPRAPRRHDARIPRDLETICMKAMSREPRHRYQTAGDMAADLRRFLDDEPILARRVGPLERSWRWSRRNPWAVGLIASVMLGSIGGFWHLSNVSRDLIRRSALEAAAMQAEIIEKVNELYTSNVVGHLPPGVEAAQDYGSRTGAIPLPATFLTELGREISAGQTGMQVRHYSDYPFRAGSGGGLQDAFGREAIGFFRERRERGAPLGEPFIRFADDFEGGSALRYAIPRVMQKNCVTCHNEDPGSTKRDWEVGDVGGVLEIIRPLRGDGALSLRGTFVLASVISGSLLGLSLLAILVGHRRAGRVTPAR
jgi:serine/threonine protein kinase